MERCPVCRARLRGDTVCGRCGEDLSLPIVCQQRAESYERDAIAALAGGDPASAKRAAKQALDLRHSPLAETLMVLAKRW